MGLTPSAWLFGGASLVLIVMGLLFLFWPLIRSRTNQAQDDPESRKQINIRLYEQRIAEIQKAVSLGELDAEDAELQTQEAGRHLISDTGSDTRQVMPRQGGRWLYALLAVILPLFSIFIYLQGDGWRLINSDETTTPWDFVIKRAQIQLEKNPEDLETMVFLARSYRALEDYDNSARVYRQLNEASNYSNPDALVEEGEILALIHEGDMRGRPTELINKALSINAYHGRALWYAGLAAVQRNDNDQAIKHWQLLSQQRLPESFRKVLDRQLVRLGAEPAIAKASVPKDSIIRVEVKADPSMLESLPKDSTVFVYVKAKGGPARPLAAQRLKLSDLPATVGLDDSMQMAGGPSLNEFDQWTVIARVSQSGDAAAQTGDPYGEIELSRKQALSNLPLVINSLWNK